MLGTIMVGERLLRDHPRALGARPREAGGTRAGSAPRTRARKLRSVHNNYLTLPVVLHDALEPLPVHVRARARWLVLVVLMRDRRVGPALLQPAAPGPHRLGDPGRPRRSRSPRSRSRSGRRTKSAAGGRDGAVRAGRGDRRASAAPPATPRTRRNGSRRAPQGIIVRHAARRSGAGAERSSSRRSTRQAMPLGNVTGMTQAERDVLGRLDRVRARRFRRMLEITAGGLRFVARFEEELAPRPSRRSARILPLEDRIIHCRWSGESNWIPWGDRDLGIGPENATRYPHPGELLSTRAGRARRSCCFPYGYCRFASKAGAARGRTTSPRSSRDRSS